MIKNFCSLCGAPAVVIPHDDGFDPDTGQPMVRLERRCSNEEKCEKEGHLWNKGLFGLNLYGSGKCSRCKQKVGGY